MKNKERVKNKLAIKLTRVTKCYTIHHEKPTLVESMFQLSKEQFYALRNISFSVAKGERVGIVGANGSGKTTLLKLISGIATPTSGRINKSGRIVSLIDLEAGFHPDLSGVKNIYLNGSILGMSKKEISTKITEIIDFADLGDFIDGQLFTYSEGMKLRLGFSVAVHSDPDILILDENISVGDENFRKKSLKKIMNYYKKRGITILTASHDLKFIQKFCDKVIYLNEGSIAVIDKPNKVIKDYLKEVRDK